MGWYLLPCGAAIMLFVISSIGFFVTEGKKEVLYGVCSVVGLACAIVQFALVM